MILGKLGGDQADDGNHDQPGDHAERACIDGGLQDGRKGGLHQHVGQHDHRGEDEAGPHGDAAGALPVQAVEEGSQESTGQCAPADAHQLRDKGDVGLGKVVIPDFYIGDGQVRFIPIVHVAAPFVDQSTVTGKMLLLSS